MAVDDTNVLNRLILYYPVSALVTLFANILQNPQDTRARSDLRLMSSVVSFLTMLERDVSEANTNIRRMLSVCAEFERIATIVLNKAEQDRANNRAGKRKAPGGQVMTEKRRKEIERAMKERGADEAAIAAGLEEGKTLEQIQVETQAAYRRPIQTPSLRASGGSGEGNTPASQQGGPGSECRSPPLPSRPPQLGGFEGFQQQLQNTSGQWTANGGAPFPSLARSGASTAAGMDFPSLPTAGSPANRQGYQPPLTANFGQPQQALAEGFDTTPSTFSPSNPAITDPLMAGDLGTNGFDAGDPGNGMMGGSFQQPFVPQDLWQMPMTLEWDWAEGLGLGSFTTGPPGMFEGGGGGFDGTDGQDGRS